MRRAIVPVTEEEREMYSQPLDLEDVERLFRLIQRRVRSSQTEKNLRRYRILYRKVLALLETQGIFRGGDDLCSG